ncbi:MAG TPA: hypothetical protein VFT72_08385 [Opitutaceae bacterium]|nr:hypothetical protein [Opitutaceae bacterium]
MKYLSLFCVFFAALFFSGCSTYVARTEPGVSMAKIQRVFVKSNFNDNHGMDGRIMRALQDRGYEVDKGPLTMLPRNAQAVVSFEDHWNWDFTTHLTNLRIEVRDVKSERLIATASFSGAVALMSSVDDIVDKLVQKLVDQSKAASAVQ